MRARLKVSRAGVELIKSFEGLRTTAARLPDGRWTLGYGHTFSAREGATATQEDADALLRFDLLPIVDAINNVVLVPLNQNQFDALVSFCFNIGVDNFAASSVCKRINEGRMTEAAQAMDSWRSAEFNGQTYVLAPLIRRRAAEKNLFLTPEDTAGNAPSLLIRPVEDSGETHSAPSEVDAPNHGGILSARPSGFAEPAAPPLSNPYAAPAPQPVLEAAPTSYTPSFEISATPQPVPAASVAPVTPERQVIDLSAFAPRAVEVTPEPAAPVAKPTIQVMADVSPAEAPKETIVEQLPHGLMSSGSVRETPAAPVVEQTPTSYDYDPTPVMSPDVQAALARAQDEQRLREETQRQAEALAAARIAEEARQREEMRLREEARLQALQQQETARLEQQRLEQEQRDRLAREEMMRAELARLEQARLEQARLEQAAAEQARLENARLESERLERERQDALRLEAERAEAARQEQIRLEQARFEQEQAERQRQDALRLEAERAEAARVEQARLEQARLEQARQEQDRLEAERAERERQEAAQREQARLEQEKLAQAQAAAAPAPSADEAEKARKAEAAAALMRLYSPYGSGGLGRPLTPNVLPKTDAGPALEPNPAPRPNTPEPVSQPAPQPVPQPVFTPEPPRATAPVQQPVAQPVAVEPEEDDDDAEVHVVSDTVSFAFKPAGSASQMPPPQVTALNPYARPIPQATETFVEVPRPSPVDLSAPSLAPQMQKAREETQEPAKTEGLHWREQLQRPLPPGYQSSEPARPVQAAAAPKPSRLDDAFETDEWTMGGDRIALSAEEMEEETVSFWRMLSSTVVWVGLSAFGLACLGVATGAFWRATNDQTVIREGHVELWKWVSIGSAALGIFLVVVSVWLIMKRLAGLKD